MLQQTTTTAVIPYFERFLSRFPNLKTLAEAPLASVLEAWAGLGYYSRARNLHKAAQALNSAQKFPQSHVQLLEYPGFGPYTARAVASLAFGESVGVVDGNVIRVLSRVEGQDWEWWLSRTRPILQARADAWVSGVPSQDMNQALMELGRTICTPKSPSCLLCPIRTACVSYEQDKVIARPRKKPRPERQLWLWQPQLTIRDGKILLRKNSTVPFLRNQWLLPGPARQVTKKPKDFHYRHSITHHDIFVTVGQPVRKVQSDDQWIPLAEIRRHIPTSLVQKALAHVGYADALERL